MPPMAQLRHRGAVRRAGEIVDQTTTLRRSMRHDDKLQELTGYALPILSGIERRAAEIVEEEDAVADASLTSRPDLALRCLAGNGDTDALSELTRRTAVPAAA